MKFADLFVFNDENRPTPRQLPEGWRKEPLSGAGDVTVLIWSPPRPTPETEGRLTIYIEVGVMAPERMPYHARGRWRGLCAIAKGYSQGVSIDRLEVCAGEALTHEETQEHYAARLLDLLTWLPGPAGEGWRALRRQVEGRVSVMEFSDAGVGEPDGEGER